MYFLLSGCQNPDVLSVIYLAKKILNLATTLIPIGVILFITIDIFKIVIGSDSDKTVKENQKLIIKRLVYSVVIFFAPTIVSVVMNSLSIVGLGTDYKQCIANANKETIGQARIQQDYEDELKEKERKQKILEDYKDQKAFSGFGGNSSGGFNGGTSDNTESDGGSGEEASGNLYQQLATKMINIASQEVGYKANGDNNKYGQELGRNNQPWCALFVTWVAKHTEAQNTNLFDDVIQKEKPILNIASATNSIYTFHTNSNLSFYYSKHYGGNYTPKKGDYIYFDWQNNWDKKIYSGMHIMNGGHVGIVTNVGNGYVHTIEGNSGQDTVFKGNYPLNSASIMGYGSWYK